MMLPRTALALLSAFAPAPLPRPPIPPHQPPPLLGLYEMWWPDHTGAPRRGQVEFNEHGYFCCWWGGKKYEGLWKLRAGTLYLTAHFLNDKPAFLAYFAVMEPCERVGAANGGGPRSFVLWRMGD